MEQKVKHIIKNGENEVQDFKNSITSAAKIAKTICAFANSFGGKLIVGVHDSGKIVGCNAQEEIHMLESAADLYVDPSIELGFEVHQVQGKNILIANIPKSNKTLHTAKESHLETKGKVYFRYEDQTRLASALFVATYKRFLMNSDEIFSWDDLKKQVLKLIEQEKIVGFIDLHKQSRLSTRKLIRILANFIKYGLCDLSFEGEFDFIITNEVGFFSRKFL